MAIGDLNYNQSTYHGNNDGEGKYTRNYYSRVSIYQNESNNNLKVTFSNGLMEISINDKTLRGRDAKLASIYVSPIKAILLSKELDAFEKYVKEGDINPNKGFGINGGMSELVSYIAFHADKDKQMYVTIGKFNKNDGKIVSSTLFKFNREYNFAVEWTNVNNNEIEKVIDNYADLEELRFVVDDFAKHSGGAIGYSTLDLARYDLGHYDNTFNQIFDKLGIQRYSGGRSGGGSSAFLDNSSSKESTHRSIDSLDDIIGEDD